MNRSADWIRFSARAETPRILIVSERRMSGGVSSSPRREFESVVAAIDNVEFALPRGGPIAQEWRSRLARRLDRPPLGLGKWLTTRRPRPGRQYDLMIVLARSISALARLAPWSIWRGVARTTACYVEDVLRKDAGRQHTLDLLGAFDHVFLTFEETSLALARASGRPCTHVPYSADALGACARAHAQPPRVIDVYAMGRRRPQVHRALQRFCRERRWFYTFDTMRSAKATSPREHRRHLLDRIRRTRFFIVQPAFGDEHERTGGQQEIGLRYYEGAACGAVLVGDRVSSASFGSLFSWPDAVVPIRPDGSDVAEVLAALDADPARVEQARRANIVNSLRTHDHAYRWRQILEGVGLSPLPAYHERVRRLHERAQEFSPDKEPARVSA